MKRWTQLHIASIIPSERRWYLEGKAKEIRFLSLSLHRWGLRYNLFCLVCTLSFWLTNQLTIKAELAQNVHQSGLENLSGKSLALGAPCKVFMMETFHAQPLHKKALTVCVLCAHRIILVGCCFCFWKNEPYCCFRNCPLRGGLYKPVKCWERIAPPCSTINRLTLY